MPKTLPTPAAQGDLGDADPALAAAVAAGDERAVVEALVGARVFVGVEPRRSHPEHDPDGPPGDDPGGDGAAGGGGDDAEMALVVLQVPSGASAVPAFTSVAALAEWRSAARPVAVTGAALAAEAVRLGHSALVIDLGQPAYATVDGSDLAQLAEVRPVPAE
jgi:hypothetical protein